MLNTPPSPFPSGIWIQSRTLENVHTFADRLPVRESTTAVEGGGVEVFAESGKKRRLDAGLVKKLGENRDYRPLDGR